MFRTEFDDKYENVVPNVVQDEVMTEALPAFDLPFQADEKSNTPFSEEIEDVQGEEESGDESDREDESEEDSDNEYSEEDDNNASENEDSENENPNSDDENDREDDNQGYNSHGDENEDSENQNPYKEPETYTTAYLLNWIRNEPIIYEDGEIEPVDYPELDEQLIVDHTEQEDLREVIEILLRETLVSGNSYFETCKDLITFSEIKIDEDLLTDCLIQAVKDEDSDMAKFFRDQGANEEAGIEEAIKKDSQEMLEALEAEVTDEHVTLAAEGNHLEALDYFLQEDFSGSYEAVLTVAGEQRKIDLVKKVCQHAELEAIYDLVKCLVQAGGETLIPLFFEYFEVEDLLTEMEQQDGSRGFYELTLRYAKDYLSESDWSRDETHKLLAQFDEKLRLTSSLLVYPKENFSGSTALRNIRDAFDKNPRFSTQAKLAANFIGVNLSTVNHYFSSSPQHPFAVKVSERYFRSAHHPFTIHVTPSTAQYKPNASLPEAKSTTDGPKIAHAGLYHVPLDSLNNRMGATEESKTTKTLTLRSANRNTYDRILSYKHDLCAYVCSKLPPNAADGIKVGFYDQYPCLMVFINHSDRSKNAKNKALEGWTQIVISYFVALVNYKAHQAGLDIEITRRSSFGFLTPTVADCNQSFRINIGIVPIDYADILIDCLNTLNATLKIINEPTADLISKNLDVSLPKDCFLSTQAYKEYLGEEKIPDIQDIMRLTWAQVEKGNTGKSTAYNLTRSSTARDSLSIQFYNEFSTCNPSFPLAYAQVFLNILRWGVSKIVAGETLGFNQATKVRIEKLFFISSQIKDENFIKFISFILTEIKSEHQSQPIAGLIAETENQTIQAIEQCLQQKKIDQLYYHLNMLNELLYSRAITTCPHSNEDGFGSDSDTEDKADKADQHIFGKKIIVGNGMRAILSALHAGANYLDPNYLHRKKKHPLLLRGAYYETADAAKLLAKFNTRLTKKSKPEIFIYDMNPCATEGKKVPEITEQEIKKLDSLKIWILDSTSATTRMHGLWLKRFKQQANAQILFFVASGFKNEQMGADKNPYGTVRVFAKNKKTLAEIIFFIKKMEQPIRSDISHHHRRLMKRLGNTPRNSAILRFSSLFQSPHEDALRAKHTSATPAVEIDEVRNVTFSPT